jgi:hypothetical protein
VTSRKGPEKGLAVEACDAAGQGREVNAGSCLGGRWRSAGRRLRRRRRGGAQSVNADAAAESERKGQRGRTTEHRESLLGSTHLTLLSTQELSISQQYTYATVA